MSSLHGFVYAQAIYPQAKESLKARSCPSLKDESFKDIATDPKLRRKADPMETSRRSFHLHVS